MQPEIKNTDDAILEAYAELECACIQMIASDDQIICDHVKRARDYLAYVIKESRYSREKPDARP